MNSKVFSIGRKKLTPCPFFRDLKESPSLGESSDVMFSLMVRYYSLTILHIFRTAAKSYRGLKLACIRPEVYVQSGERYKIIFCSLNI